MNTTAASATCRASRGVAWKACGSAPGGSITYTDSRSPPIRETMSPTMVVVATTRTAPAAGSSICPSAYAGMPANATTKATNIPVLKCLMSQI